MPAIEHKLRLVSRNGDLARYECSCGYRPKPRIAAIDIDPEEDLAIHIAANTRKPLLERPDESDSDRAFAEAMEPRPGYETTGYQVHDEITFNQLSQHSTDVRIVSELHNLHVFPGELTEFRQLAAPWLPDNPPLHYQQGGIHSDPMIRLLAYRAWGRRDLDWRLPIAKPADDGICRDDNCSIEGIHPKHRRAALPRRRATSERERNLHDRHCADPACDGQCVR